MILMDRYYQLLLGEKRDDSLHPMEAKKQLAHKLTVRYHDETAAIRKRVRLGRPVFPSATTQPVRSNCRWLIFRADGTVLQLAAHAYQAGFQLKKSNGELKKQSILPGAVQLNGEKLTDPNATPAIKAGDILRLSKKHSVKFG